MSTKRGPLKTNYDLLLIGLYAIASPGMELFPEGSPIRFLLVLPLVFLAPGYLGTVALFPEDTPISQINAFGLSGDTLGPVERFALSFGLSFALVPLYVMALTVTGIGVTGFAFAYFAVFVIVLALIAGVRRSRVPEARRYIPAPVTVFKGSTTPMRNGATVTRMASIVLAVALLTSLVMFAIVLAFPQEGETYSELMIGTSDDEGEFVLSGYPDNLTVDEPATYLIQVGNQEGTDATYQLEVELQRMENDTVVESEVIDSKSIELADGERQLIETNVEATMVGENLRLKVTLRGESPAEVDAEQSTHVWVDVHNPAAEEIASAPIPP